MDRHNYILNEDGKERKKDQKKSRQGNKMIDESYEREVMQWRKWWKENVERIDGWRYAPATAKQDSNIIGDIWYKCPRSSQLAKEEYQERRRRR